ncbi:MAG TPA: 50S ribosomal protein L29 [Phototrophicaceae bacterium]|nr:50S ribosomal protein L29 [Phototrophicaceae bacterium]
MSSVQELRQLSSEALYNELEDQKESLFNLRFQKSFGQLEDPNALRNAKREVARILTILREREIEAQQGEGDDNA